MTARPFIALALLALAAPVQAGAAAASPKVVASTAFLGAAEGYPDLEAIYFVVRTDRPLRRDDDVPNARFDVAGDQERPYTLVDRGRTCYRSRHLLSDDGRTRPSKASGRRPATARPGSVLRFRVVVGTDLVSDTPRTLLNHRLTLHRERAGDRAGRSIGCGRAAER